MSAPLNPLAVQLNERLEAVAPEIYQMLSEMGRRLYFPKGILSQSAEAKEKAHRFNATIGIATESGTAMHLRSVAEQIGDVPAAAAFPYAPAAGQQPLREKWREKMLSENPGLRNKSFGMPVVTSAITHGLSLVGDLFVDPGDVLLMPDKLWGNYRLTYEVRQGGKIETFPFYKGKGFDVEGFAQGLTRAAKGREKLIVLLNFPNNPTGYMPSVAEGEGIVSALLAQAERGTKLVSVLDDAYFGLFYHLGGRSMTESLFVPLTNAHRNILAVRLDGATKELFVWGLRCGFVTFGAGRAEASDEVSAVLDAKLRGAIRSGISSVPQLSQSLITRALASPSIDREREEKREILHARAERVLEVANDPRFQSSWDVYPFNSGYFMCVKTKGADAEAVRLQLLDRDGIGVISVGKSDVRVAFSCLELDEIEPLFEALHLAIQELAQGG